MRWPLWTVCGALLLSSCSGPQQPLITPQAREQLRAGVEQVRAAALRHDRSASDAALLALTEDIAAAQARGELDPAYARSLLEAADRVAADVARLPAPPAPAPVTIVPSPQIVRVAVPAPAPVVQPPGTAPAPAERKAVPGRNRGKTGAGEHNGRGVQGNGQR